MCVIIHKPAAGRLSLEQLQQCAAKNRDGIGMAWFQKGGTIHVEKGVTVERVAQAAEDATYYDLFVHFRLATHGPKTAAMMHPFGVSEKTTKVLDPHLAKQVLFHNGVISGFGTDKLSDTAHFCQSVLSRVPELDNRKALMELTGDKFLYLYIASDNFGRIEKVGKWDTVEGTHFSNLHWKPYTYKAPKGEKGKSGVRVYQGGNYGWDQETGRYQEWDFSSRRNVVVDSSDSRIITGITAPATQSVILPPSDVVSDDPSVVNDAIEADLANHQRSAFEYAFKDSPLDVLQRAINLRTAELAALNLAKPGHRARKLVIERALEVLEDLRIERLLESAKVVGVSVAKVDSDTMQRAILDRELSELQADSDKRKEIEREHHQLNGASVLGE